MDKDAGTFVKGLEALQPANSHREIRPDFRAVDGETTLGLRMGDIFNLSKAYIDMPIDEIEKLLQSPIYEIKVGAHSIMGKSAEHKKSSEARKRELYDLYLKYAGTMNMWQLVDVSCHKVIGAYLMDKPRDILYDLAKSPNWWERRIAVYSTLWFMRKGDLDDAFQLSELLINDEEHFIHTAVGGVLREAGKQDQERLIRILDQYASTMPRVALRYAIEHFDKPLRDHYLNLKNQTKQE